MGAFGDPLFGPLRGVVSGIGIGGVSVNVVVARLVASGRGVTVVRPLSFPLEAWLLVRPAS